MEDNKFEWLDPDVEVPADSEEIVLVICSGRAGNVTLKDAFMMAVYDGIEREWILEMYPEAKGVSVKWWGFLPDAPLENSSDDVV